MTRFLITQLQYHFKVLSIFSRRQIDDAFLTFPRKQNSTFHANCLHWRQFAWKFESCFLGKVRKNISKCCPLKILPRVLSVKFLHSLGEFSQWQTDDISLRKQSLTFHAKLPLGLQLAWIRVEIFVDFFYYLIWSFMALSTLLRSWWAGQITYIQPALFSKFFVHILLPVTDNWPSWIRRRGRVASEIISWSISTKIMWSSWDLQLDAQTSVLWSPAKLRLISQSTIFQFCWDIVSKYVGLFPNEMYKKLILSKAASSSATEAPESIPFINPKVHEASNMPETSNSINCIDKSSAEFSPAS